MTLNISLLDAGPKPHLLLQESFIPKSPTMLAMKDHVSKHTHTLAYQKLFRDACMLVDFLTFHLTVSYNMSKKSGLMGFRLGLTQTGLCSYRRGLVA